MEFWPETGTGAVSVTNILIYVSRWDRIGAIRLGLERIVHPRIARAALSGCRRLTTQVRLGRGLLVRIPICRSIKKRMRGVREIASAASSAFLGASNPTAAGADNEKLDYMTLQAFTPVREATTAEGSARRPADPRHCVRWSSAASTQGYQTCFLDLTRRGWRRGLGLGFFPC